MALRKKRNVKQVSQLEHAKKKSMWIGSSEMQNIKLHIYNTKTNLMEVKAMKFPPGLLKIIDEIVVNAMDHWVNYPRLVKNIHITFDNKTGQVSVRNDGPGIEIKKTKNIHGKEMYTVQLIAAEFLAGDNLDDDAERVTGGTNGAGLKLTNAFSDELTIDTTDEDNKLFYRQQFTERLEKIHEPEIMKLSKAPKDKRKSQTTITFTPSYEDAFHYDGGYDAKRDGKTIESLIRTRAFHAAAYARCNVYYNDDLIEISSTSSGPKSPTNRMKNFIEFVNLFYDEKEPEVWNGSMGVTHKWDVCIGPSDGKARNFSLINGIWVHQGGSHIKQIQDQLVLELKPKVEKLTKKSKTKFNPNFILNNVFIFVRGSITNPTFGGQVKAKIENPKSKFKNYKFKKRDIDVLWELLEGYITSSFLGRVADKKKTRVTRSIGNIPKAVDARYAGQKSKYKKTTLIVCEGDSACGTIVKGIVNKKTSLSYDYYGTFNIQGVPLNARKQTTIFTNKRTKKQEFVRSQKFQDNERISSFVKMSGLDYGKSYETDKECDTLRYGRIVVATDQDEDGKGNIFGLFLSFIHLFWPELINRGYICRLNTPIVMAYPKVKGKYVEEFYTVPCYEKWCKENFKTQESLKSKYRIKYFKGLGSIKSEEIAPIFCKFKKLLNIYTLDDEADEKMDAYYGDDPKKRKLLLKDPVSDEPSEGPEIRTSEQLDIDTKSYQRDNIRRKLPNAIDGQVPSRRKLLYAASKQFGTTKATNKESKINAYVNRASASTAYHHGEASLCQTAIKMAQSHPGGRKFPFLYPEGHFGTRQTGGKDHASPRYAFTKLNQRLFYQMFPIEDNPLLKYVFDDADRCEPEYYVPVIPLAVLESQELPGTGWKIKTWARDVFSVFRNVRSLLEDEEKPLEKMPLCMRDYKGEIRKVKNRLYSMGKYKFYKTSNKLIITELPLSLHSSMFARLASSKYGSKKYSLLERDQVKGQIIDTTNDDEVRVEVNLKPEGVKEISELGSEHFDCFETWMNLKVAMDDHLNMISADDTVLEFKTYEHIVKNWFPVRKALYVKRINRMLILVRLRIELLENIIRFSTSHAKYNINRKMKREQVDTILEDNKYTKFNKPPLDNPGFIATEDLKTVILGKSAKYDYLVNLRYGDLIEGACKKREKKLDELKKQLKELLKDDGSDGSFAGRKTWIKELDRLEETIKLGVAKGWKYGELEAGKFRR